MFDEIQDFLKSRGINDFDELRADERESYFKLLEVVESSQITLDDFRKNVKTMRQAVELALATEKLTKSEDLFLKARLKNYILFETFFDKPERAKDMLNQYKKTGRK